MLEAKVKVEASRKLEAKLKLGAVATLNLKL
jgi:hypothetical protein